MRTIRVAVLVVALVLLAVGAFAQMPDRCVSSGAITADAAVTAAGTSGVLCGVQAVPTAGAATTCTISAGSAAGGTAYMTGYVAAGGGVGGAALPVYYSSGLYIDVTLASGGYCIVYYMKLN